MKKFSNVVDNEIVENTKFNTPKTKVNNLEKKISDATTLIHINQYITNKQKLETKIGDGDKKYQIQVVWLLQLFWMETLVKFKTKYQILIV